MTSSLPLHQKKAINIGVSFLYSLSVMSRPLGCLHLSTIKVPPSYGQGPRYKTSNALSVTFHLKNCTKDVTSFIWSSILYFPLTVDDGFPFFWCWGGGAEKTLPLQKWNFVTLTLARPSCYYRWGTRSRFCVDSSRAPFSKCEELNNFVLLSLFGSLEFVEIASYQKSAS